MAEFNSCAHLLDNIDEATEKYCKVKEWENYDVSPLNEMLKMQNQLQVNLKEKLGRTIPPDELKTKGELVDFLFDQNVHLMMNLWNLFMHVQVQINQIKNKLQFGKNGNLIFGFF